MSTKPLPPSDAPKVRTTREHLRCLCCGKVSSTDSFARQHSPEVLTQSFVGGPGGIRWSRRPVDAERDRKALGVLRSAAQRAARWCDIALGAQENNVDNKPPSKPPAKTPYELAQEFCANIGLGADKELLAAVADAIASGFGRASKKPEGPSDAG